MSQNISVYHLALTMHAFHTCIISVTLVYFTCGVRECIENVPLRRFYKRRNCYKSKIPILARSNLQTLKECFDFAKKRRALAINFSPPNARVTKRNGTDDFFSTCQILGCPEIGNSSTLVKDVNFDYYSIYGNFNDSVTGNISCIKSVGMFTLNKNKLNYTEAASSCQEIGGELAHIVSEDRTNGLSTIITNGIDDWFKAAYVGLDDCETEGNFVTPLGAPLQCFNYRAWAPGHPRAKHRNQDCVTLDSERSWKVVDCKQQLPFVCELFPEDTQNDESGDLKEPNCTNIKIKRKLRECLEEKRLYEIFKNSSREDICALLDVHEDEN